MIILQTLWAKVWPYVALIAAAFAAFLGIRQSGKAAGRAEVEQEQQKAAADDRRKAREVDQKIDAMGDDAIRRHAEQWVRDNEQ